MKTLSIIIPCYNASNSIGKTIESFDLDNLQDEIDVIVVDDGSTDDSKKVIDKYKKKYPKAIKYFKKENGNYGSVINFAKHKLESKFVKTCDADDTYVQANMVRLIDELKQLDDADIVFTNFSFINTNTGVVTKNSLTNQFNWTQTTKVYSIDKLSKSKIGYPTIHSMLFKSILFESIKDSPEGIYYTDSFTVYECLKYAKTIAYIPHLYIYNYFVSNEEQSINITNISRRKQQVETVLNCIMTDSNLSGLSKKHKTWLFSVMRMVIKFVFLAITFDDYDQEHKVHDVEKVTKFVLEHIENNKQLKTVLDLQLNYMFKSHPGTVLWSIKKCYGLSIGKFARSTKNSNKKKETKRRELADEYFYSLEETKKK